MSVPRCLAKEHQSLGIMLPEDEEAPVPDNRRQKKSVTFDFSAFEPAIAPESPAKPARKRTPPTDSCSRNKVARMPTNSPTEATKSPGNRAGETLGKSDEEMASAAARFRVMVEDDQEVWRQLREGSHEKRPYTRNSTHLEPDLDTKMPATREKTVDDNDDGFAVALPDASDDSEEEEIIIVPGEADFNNDGEINANPNTNIRQQFRDYVAKAKQHWFPKLTDQQVRGIRLLHILGKKRAPLDTYDDIMHWHFQDTGELQADDKLQDTDLYVSRQKLLKELSIRYNMDTKFPIIKRVNLPSSRSTVNMVCHDAGDCLQSLFTDPRVSDDDFWFFDKNPLAAPPENLTLIADLQTGNAYRAAYKGYVTKHNHVLLPIVMYIDGAVTGQFQVLRVVMMMTLPPNQPRRRRKKAPSRGNVALATRSDCLW